MMNVYRRLQYIYPTKVAERTVVRFWLNKQFPGGGVVIGGCGRSGTTLLLGLLSAHSQIHAISEETWSLYPTVQPLRLLKALHGKQHPKPQSLRWCEKTPRNVLNVQEILDFLGPQGKFLHIVRDGRDVVTSKHPTKPGTYWVPIERWVSDVTAGLTAEQSPQVMRVRYEDLVCDPATIISKILNFIELDFEEDVLRWEKSGTVRNHKAWEGEATTLNTNSIGNWRQSEHRERIQELMTFEAATELLAKLNYI